ncbi:acyl-CoA dehydrogenase, partial [Providencia rettgeri]|nr:acyl-CoA dehydrogenase [Providencia rettgeri]
DQEGVERLDDWHGFGQRLTGSGTTVLTDVLVPESAIIRFPRQEPTPLVAYFQLVHLATLAGIAQAVQRDAVAYVQARKRVFSHGSAALPKDDPLVQHIVGELASTAYIAQLAVRDVAAHLQNIADQRQADVEVSRETLDALELRTAQAQVAVVEPVLRAATRLFDVGGSTALE